MRLDTVAATKNSHGSYTLGCRLSAFWPRNAAIPFWEGALLKQAQNPGKTIVYSTRRPASVGLVKDFRFGSDEDFRFSCRRHFDEQQQFFAVVGSVVG